MKQPSLKRQLAIVEKFNNAYNVGDTVNVKQDDGSVIEWTVKHPATILGGHTAVIWINERVGAYAADRVIY